MLRANPTLTPLSLTDALKTLKKLAVVLVTLGIVDSQLLAMQQDFSQLLHTFVTPIQGKAETCKFKTSFDGSCSNCLAAYCGDVCYTEKVVRDMSY